MRREAAIRTVLLFSLASVALACTRPSSAPPGDADAEPAPAGTPFIAPPGPLIEGGSTLRTARSTSEANASHHRLNLTCRAMAVEGSPVIAVDGGSRALAVSDFADGWVTLGNGDSLTVTLPRTGRELGFEGPAVVEPCVGTTLDEAWVLRGRFQGARGSGESPGAEQWVVTPFAVLRYGAAILDVSLDDAGVHASLKGGSATILPEGASAWQRLSEGPPRVVKGAPLGKAGSAAAADRCAKAAAAARTLEDALVLPDAAASPTFGDLAMRANDAHVLGRAACAMAQLRAGAAGVAASAGGPSK